MKDIKNCIVGVYVNSKLQGTGYVVTPQLIITCAHVLTDESKPTKDKVTVKFHCLGAKSRAVAVEVLTEFWSPAEKDDVAVLKLRPEYKLGPCVEIAAIGRIAGRKNTECELFGYPDLANVHGVGGRARVIEDVREIQGRKLLQLKSEEAMSGFSGCPVYDPTTKEVVGTIVEKVTGDNNKFVFATPMEVILEIIPSLPVEDVDFTRAIRANFTNQVKLLLTHKPMIVQYLKDKIDLAGQAGDVERNELLIKKILQLPLEEFLKIVVIAVNEKHEDADAQGFRDFARFVVPQIYQDSLLKEVRRNIAARKNFLVLPTSHRSIIELVLAGAFGRKLGFPKDWNPMTDNSKAEAEIEPWPEVGTMPDNKLIESFERGIMQKARVGNVAKGFKSQTAVIKQILQRLREEEPPVVFYYIYPQGWGRVSDLEKLYTEVVFIVHDHTDPSEHDTDLFYYLSRIFTPESER
jgi:hypothetical protein